VPMGEEHRCGHERVFAYNVMNPIDAVLTGIDDDAWLPGTRGKHIAVGSPRAGGKARNEQGSSLRRPVVDVSLTTRSA